MNNSLKTLFLLFMISFLSCKSNSENTARTTRSNNDANGQVVTADTSTITADTSISKPKETPEINTKIESKPTAAKESPSTPPSSKQEDTKIESSSNPTNPVTPSIPKVTTTSSPVPSSNTEQNPPNSPVIPNPKEEVIAPKPAKPIVESIIVGPPTHKAWDDLLKKHVSSSGEVNYQGIKADKAALEAYLQKLEDSKPTTTWTRDQELCYWINAYNAYTIKLIVDNYPVSSITDLHNGKPWDVKWIALDGKTLSLNDIENNIIRPKYKEPRIHFAVNCAAKSCPPLLNAAFTETQLESQLESQTQKFINNPKFNALNDSKVEISKIFEWYADDFENVLVFLRKYSNKVSKDAKILYKEYDWKLNRR